MPTVKNLSAGEIVPQMGFAPTQNQNGGWTATRDYYMLESTWESSAVQLRFSRGTPITTADPSIDTLYNFLTVESKTASYEDSDTVKVTISYTGHPSAQYGGEGGTSLTLEAQPTYRLSGRLRELPLTEHPKYETLPPDEQFVIGQAISGAGIISYDGTQVGTYISGANNRPLFSPFLDETLAEISISSEDGLNFANLIKKGIVTFQSPSFVWSETTQGEVGMPGTQLAKLGKIDTPRGNPPTPSGQGRNWMLTDAQQEQRGDLYSTSLEWTLSPEEGWDEFLYL